MDNKHTDKEYELELQQLKELFGEMSLAVQKMGNECISTLYEADLGKARKVIQQDDQVDQLELEIDRKCINAIARRQPLGTDLRFIVSLLKAVTDLERIGDLFVSIAERSIELMQNDKYPVKTPELKQMLEKVIRNISDSISAFLASDDKKAISLILEDRQIDAFHAQLFRNSMEKMRSGNNQFSEVSRMMTIIGCVERIGDHAKNICEYTCYMATGRQISHSHCKGEDARSLPRCIVFLCVQNSARSQIAEGLAKHILPAEIDVFSAGSAPADAVNPTAIQIMKEIGIDISKHHPKRLTDIPLGKVDLVITLCAEEICINLPGAISRKSWLFDDPALIESEEDRIDAFRRIRDELKGKIEALNKEFRK